MRLIAGMLCRNEAWIAGLSLRVALVWNDAVVVLLHRCTDASMAITEEVSAEHPGRVIVLRDDSETWEEMPMRQRMLDEARAAKATHFSIIDFDEVLTGNVAPGRLREFVDGLLPTHILTLPLYNLRGGIHRYHSNGLWGNRIVSLAFADDPLLHWGGDTFHQREPRGKRLQGFQPIAQGEGGVMHLWSSSIERCRAKHRAYKIHEAIRWPAKDHRDIEFMYNQWELGGLREDPKNWTFADVPESWWSPYKDLMKYLDVDAKPWQDQWCDEMIEKYGREYFKGLTV